MHVEPGSFQEGGRELQRAGTVLQLLGTGIQEGCPWASFLHDSDESILHSSA